MHACKLKLYLLASPHNYLSAYRYRTKAEGNCTNQVTSCNACYFAREERCLPSKCRTTLKKYKCAGLTGPKLKNCLKRWGTCVKEAFKDIHGKVLQQL